MSKAPSGIFIAAAFLKENTMPLHHPRFTRLAIQNLSSVDSDFDAFDMNDNFNTVDSDNDIDDETIHYDGFDTPTWQAGMVTLTHFLRD